MSDEYSGIHHVINSEYTKDRFKQRVDEYYQKHGYVIFMVRTGRQRTLTQNRAMHQFFRQLADALNSAGLEQEITLKKGEKRGKTITVPWTCESVKDVIWKPVQRAMYGKESTSDLERKECGEIHKVLCARLNEAFSVTVPAWPEKEQDE